MSRRPAALPTLLVALALFGLTFEFLAMQLRSGRDPALGPAVAASAPGKVRPRKKIVITRVISAGGAAATQATSSYAGTATASPAPVSTSSS